MEISIVVSDWSGQNKLVLGKTQLMEETQGDGASPLRHPPRLPLFKLVPKVRSPEELVNITSTSESALLPQKMRSLGSS